MKTVVNLSYFVSLFLFNACMFAESVEKDTLNFYIGTYPVHVTYPLLTTDEVTVFGVKVPFDQKWPEQGDQQIIFEAGGPLQINGGDLSAGKYVMSFIPSQAQWTIVFTALQEINQDDSLGKEALRITAFGQKDSVVDQLRFTWEEYERLVLAYGETRVTFWIKSNEVTD